jgi:hypothetical protein
MAAASFTKAQAKALCDNKEYDVFLKSISPKLNQLTGVELKDLVDYSRKLRDQWRDVARKQRRSTQSAKGQRQTIANARSADKAALFEQVHNAFNERLKDVQTGAVEIPKGQRPASVPRKDRKIVTRAVRSVNKTRLKDAKQEINKARRILEKTTQPQQESEIATSNSKAPAKKPSPKKAALKSAPAKVAVKKAAVKKASASKSRSKKLAKRAEIQSTIAGSSNVATQAPKPSAGGVPSKKARNRNLNAIASKNRTKVGGSTRIKAHVSSAGRRNQSRRDAKN